MAALQIDPSALAGITGTLLGKRVSSAAQYRADIDLAADTLAFLARLDAQQSPLLAATFGGDATAAAAAAATTTTAAAATTAPAAASLQTLAANLCGFQNRFAEPMALPFGFGFDMPSRLPTPRPVDWLLAIGAAFPPAASSAASSSSSASASLCDSLVILGDEQWRAAHSGQEPPAGLTAFAWIGDLFRLFLAASADAALAAEASRLASCWYQVATEVDFDESDDALQGAAVGDGIEEIAEAAPGLMALLGLGGGGGGGDDDDDDEDDGDYDPEADPDAGEDDDEDDIEDDDEIGDFEADLTGGRPLEDLSVRELRTILGALNIDYAGCVEKRELVEKIAAARVGGGAKEKKTKKPAAAAGGDDDEWEDVDGEEAADGDDDGGDGDGDDQGDDDGGDDEDGDEDGDEAGIEAGEEPEAARRVREVALQAVERLHAYMPDPERDAVWFGRTMTRQSLGERSEWFPWGAPPLERLQRVIADATVPAAVRASAERAHRAITSSGM